MSRNRCYKEKTQGIVCKKGFEVVRRISGGMNSTDWLTCAEWFGDLLPILRETNELVQNNSQCSDAFSKGADGSTDPSDTAIKNELSIVCVFSCY